MNPADLAIALLLAACSALAWHRRARPLALTLTAGLVAHVALCGIAALPDAPRPYTGLRALAMRVEIVLRIGWPGVVLAGVVATVRREKR